MKHRMHVFFSRISPAALRLHWAGRGRLAAGKSIKWLFVLGLLFLGFGFLSSVPHAALAQSAPTPVPTATPDVIAVIDGAPNGGVCWPYCYNDWSNKVTCDYEDATHSAIDCSGSFQYTFYNPIVGGNAGFNVGVFPLPAPGGREVPTIYYYEFHSTSNTSMSATLCNEHCYHGQTLSNDDVGTFYSADPGWAYHLVTLGVNYENPPCASGPCGPFKGAFTYRVSLAPLNPCVDLTGSVDPPDVGASMQLPAGNCAGGGYVRGTTVTATVHVDPYGPYLPGGWVYSGLGEPDTPITPNPSDDQITLKVTDSGAWIVNELQTKPPLILVHGFQGFTGAGAGNPYSFNCGTMVMRYADQRSAGQPDDWTMGSLPQAFSRDYDVWMAYYTTSRNGTPSLESNADCLQRDIDRVFSVSKNQPIVLVAHSTGGPISRACLSRQDCNSKVRALYTLGAPNAGLNKTTLALEAFGLHPLGLTLDTAFCANQTAVCEMTMPYMKFFNNFNGNQPGVKYVFIGGNAPGAGPAQAPYGPLNGILNLYEGPNDGFVGHSSAVGWVYNPPPSLPSLTKFEPFWWPLGSLPTQLWTDEAHLYVWVGGAVQHSYLGQMAFFNAASPDSRSFSPSFHCIEWKEGLETRPAACADADIFFGLPAVPHLAQQAQPVASALLSGPNGHLNPGDPDVSGQIPLDGGGPVSFFMTWNAGTPDFSLTEPDGVTVVTPDYAAANPDLVTYSSSPATSETPPIAIYTLPNAAAGTWTLHIGPGSLPPGGADFSSSAVFQSTRTFQVSSDASLYHPGDNALLTATLQDTNGGLAGASVAGSFHRSDGATDNVIFNDQGNGTYTANYAIPATTGLSFMTVTAGGQAGGSTFSRQELLALSIVSPRATLNGNYSATPQDTDANGRYDSLDVQVGVNAVQAGDFTVSADLVVGDRLIAHTAAPTTLSAGDNTVVLSFNADDIRRAQLNGPYTLTHLAVLDSAQTHLPTDQKDDAWQTQAYNWQDFGVCYSLTTVVAPASAGSIAADPNPDCGSSQYSAGTQVTLTSAAGTGYVFAGWEGDDPGAAPALTLTLNRNLNITALFQAQRFVISGHVGIAGAQLNYSDGGSQRVVADINGNYSFTVPYDWSGTVTLSYPWGQPYAFTPAGRTYANVIADLPAENYSLVVPTSTPTFTPTVTPTPTVTLTPVPSATITATPSLTPTPSGNGTGLAGEYFNNQTLSGVPAYVRLDPQVNFITWGSDGPLPGTIDPLFSARWTGQLEAPVSDDYVFSINADDGVRLWIDGQLLVDDWAAPTLYWHDTQPVTLVAGQKYDITIELYNSFGQSALEFYWEGDSGAVPFELVPTGRLYLPPGGLPAAATFTPTPSATAVPTVIVDDFDAATLGPDWEWYLPVSGPSWSLTADPGSLQLVVPPNHDHWGPGVDNSPQMRRFDMGSGDFSIETHIAVDPASTGDGWHSVLMVGFDANDQLWLGAGSDGALHSVRAGQANITDAVAPYPLTLRIDKRGSLYTFEYKPDGGAWTSLGGTYTVDSPVAYVGLLERTFYSSTGNAVLDVDYFRLERFGPPGPTRTPTATFTLTPTHPARVTISGNAAVPGALLKYVDGTARTVTADAAGNYSFSVPYGWSGTVTPAAAGKTFTPASRSYTGVTADQSAQNYAAVLSVTSAGAQDGWVLESSENSTVGGSLNTAATTFQLGDDAARRQYRAVLSFDTSGLPDHARIQSALLQIKQSGLAAGSNPFNVLGGLLVDIRTGFFGSSAALQLADFNAAASALKVGTFNKTPSAGWYSASLAAAGLGKINLIGLTQLRLRFNLDDNNNRVADYMKFFSGNSTTNRPVLVITFTQ